VAQGIAVLAVLGGQQRLKPRDFVQPSDGPLVPYSLRFRDPVSGKSVRARSIAALAEIVARYGGVEIVGTAEDSRAACCVDTANQ
jgi:hypothetical protein